MKKAIVFLSLLFSLVAFAGDPTCTKDESATQIIEQLVIKTDVPSHLKGATIVVRLADGRETSVPAERFKVVPRKQQFVVTKTEKATTLSCTTNEPRKNRVSLLGGHGAQEGLKSSTSGTTTTVESKVGLVGGAQYQRMLGERFSIGVQGQTNKTGSLLIGLDF